MVLSLITGMKYVQSVLVLVSSLFIFVVFLGVQHYKLTSVYTAK